MLWFSPDPEMPKLRTGPAPTPLELLDLSQLIILGRTQNSTLSRLLAIPDPQLANYFEAN